MMAKESVLRAMDASSLREAAHADAYRDMLLKYTHDVREAHQAFLQKRKPVFTGK
jgi:enoyl-CoA hydratase/carnithine racemase